MHTQLGLQLINHSPENRRRVRISRVTEQRVQYTIADAVSGAATGYQMLSVAI